MKHSRWLAFVAFAVCACKGGIDANKAKEFVGTTVEKATGTKPTSVSCPDNVKAVKDEVFVCTASFGAATAKVTIKQLDDKGNVQISDMSGVIVMKAVEEQATKGLTEQASEAISVTCPGDPIRASTAGTTYQCTAKAGDGSTRPVEVNVKDEAGNFAYRVITK